MLQLDLRGQKYVPPAVEKPEPNPAALNQPNSLNRASRIRSLARIVDDNKAILQRLQSAKSHYAINKWEGDFQKKQNLGRRIQENSDRYQKNPYFLHSVCTTQLLENKSMTNASVNGRISNANKNHQRITSAQQGRSQSNRNARRQIGRSHTAQNVPGRGVKPFGA